MALGNRTFVAASGVALFACASAPPPAEEPNSGQSYPHALRLICEVDRRAGIVPDDPISTSYTRENYLIDRVENPDGLYFLSVFRKKTGRDQVSMLAAEARQHGVKTCPLADTLLRVVESQPPDEPATAVQPPR